MPWKQIVRESLPGIWTEKSKDGKTYMESDHWQMGKVRMSINDEERYVCDCAGGKPIVSYAAQSAYWPVVAKITTEKSRKQNAIFFRKGIG